MIVARDSRRAGRMADPIAALTLEDEGDLGRRLGGGPTGRALGRSHDLPTDADVSGPSDEILGPVTGPSPADRPEVLFVCVHNAGRSQMAAALTAHLGGGRVGVRSGGSDPAERVNPLVVEAMAELGFDLAGAVPTRVSGEMVGAADVVVTMGCGDECPFVPGRRYEDWPVSDPAAESSLDGVRAIRDDIRRRVETLLAELGVTPGRLPATPSGR